MASAASVDDLRPGDHACLTYSDAEERLDIVAAFVRDGLGAGQKVICFTDVGGQVDVANELAERDVKPANGGQLAIRDNDAAWLSAGRASATNMIEMLSGELETAHRDGFAGLRVTADMCWATRPVAAVDELLVFETRVAGLFADGRLTAICQYDRQSFDQVTLAFAAKAHPARWPPPSTTRTRCCASAGSTRRPASGWPARSTTGGCPSSTRRSPRRCGWAVTSTSTSRT
ncbi:MEDS domain-containing protein [Phytohabitans flavus]|uniref:MEDS domain-containing protein n=1 Tax=Phytohabitans flavus TaxID=1076124 RepID=UPI0036301601